MCAGIREFIVYLYRPWRHSTRDWCAESENTLNLPIHCLCLHFRLFLKVWNIFLQPSDLTLKRLSFDINLIKGFMIESVFFCSLKLVNNGFFENFAVKLYPVRVVAGAFECSYHSCWFNILCFRFALCYLIINVFR